MKMFQDLCEWLRRQLFFAKLRAKEDIESVIRLCKVDSILISLHKEKERKATKQNGVYGLRIDLYLREPTDGTRIFSPSHVHLLDGPLKIVHYYHVMEKF